MTGTPEQITAKKAARIRSNVRQFFRYYREQLEQTEKPALKEFNRQNSKPWKRCKWKRSKHWRE